jgi:choline dehydrogenase-like flavoprotein
MKANQAELQPNTPKAQTGTLGPKAYKAALALAEALIPGSDNVPRADERTLGALEDILAQVTRNSDWPLKSWGVLMQVFDEATRVQTGKRFQDLDNAAQDKVIARWSKNPITRVPLTFVNAVLKLAHFDHDPIFEALGGQRTHASSQNSPWPKEQVIDAQAWQGDTDFECDVVVIGTGAGGAVVAHELAHKGHAVLMIEEGRYRQRSEFRGSSVDSMRHFYRGQPFTVGNNVVPVFVGKLVGGSTAVNTGTCFRTPDRILAGWCESLKSDDFSPSQMEPYFSQVEEMLQVAPAPRQFAGPVADIVERGCNRLGWSHFAVPRNASDCRGEGFCQFGCASGARRSADQTYVPGALKKGALLITQLRADEIIVEQGQAVGVKACSVEKNRSFEIRARKVVFAGGAIATPLFLMKQGLCNSSGQVGRNLSIHPSTGVTGLFDENIDAHRYIPQGYGCDEFLDEGMLILSALPTQNFMPMLFGVTGRRFNEAMSLRNHMATLAVLVEDYEAQGRVWFDYKKQPLISYNLSAADCHKLHTGISHCAEILQQSGARKLYPALQSHPLLETRSDLQNFRRAKLKASDYLLTSYHPLGTCKMGPDPKTSVVNTDHQTHDLPNLFIVDGSTVPSPPSVNPQITIMAMAMRAAEKIHAHL